MSEPRPEPPYEASAGDDMSEPRPEPPRKSSNHPFGRSALRLVLNTLPRFISILLITMIGVAFFSGLRVTGDYMRANANEYLNATNTMDIRIVSTFGFDEADLAAIRTTPGVMDVYAGYNTNLLVHIGDGAVSAHVLSVDPRSQAAQNNPWLFNGRLPEHSGEIVVEPTYLRHSRKSIGDTVTFESGNDSQLQDIIKRGSFTIVGVADSPLFLAEDRGSSEIGNGSNSYFFLICADDFAYSVYTEAYIRIADVQPDDSRFSPEYLLAVSAEIHNLENTAAARSPQRYAELVDETTKTLNDAQAEVDDGHAELTAGWYELVDARLELDKAWQLMKDARRELDDGWAESTAGRQELDNGWVELRNSRKKIDDGWDQMAAARQELDEGWAEFADSRPRLDEAWALSEQGWDQLEAARLQLEQSALLISIGWTVLDATLELGMPQWLYDIAASQLANLEQQYQDGLADWQAGLDLYYQGIVELEDAEAKYATGLAGLADGEIEYENGVAELRQAEVDYQAGRAKLQQAETDYDTGLAKLDQAELDYAEGVAELDKAEADYAEGLLKFTNKRADALVDLTQAQQDIDDGWEALGKLKRPQWYILGIRDNAGFRTFESEAAQLDALAFILPGFFFLIAALVSMTAVTRLVDAERTTIATFKALGYKNSVISLRYLLYALVASSIGSAAGIALGYNILPPMIFDAFRTLFNIPHSVHPFSFEYTLISAAVAIVFTVLPALYVVRSSVRETPAQAMRPLAPKAGRRIIIERIRPLWRRLSFLQKVTARNLLRYKKRLFMTVFGVAGCTALIFTALGLHDALGTLTQKQFGQIYKSDVTIDFQLQDGSSLSSFTAKLDAAPDIS
ncbi:MAG: ABC transporter permease, partial [Coriobacteriales bacterium]|nr:ABC transporter permease [Coriobacteriales bacterium]